MKSVLLLSVLALCMLTVLARPRLLHKIKQRVLEHSCSVLNGTGGPVAVTFNLTSCPDCSSCDLGPIAFSYSGQKVSAYFCRHPNFPFRHLARRACKVDGTTKHPCRNNGSCSIGPMEVQLKDGNTSIIYLCEKPDKTEPTPITDMYSDACLVKFTNGTVARDDSSCCNCTGGPVTLTQDGVQYQLTYCENADHAHGSHEHKSREHKSHSGSHEHKSREHKHQRGSREHKSREHKPQRGSREQDSEQKSSQHQPKSTQRGQGPRDPPGWRGFFGGLFRRGGPGGRGPQGAGGRGPPRRH